MHVPDITRGGSNCMLGYWYRANGKAPKYFGYLTKHSVVSMDVEWRLKLEPSYDVELITVRAKRPYGKIAQGESDMISAI